MKQFRANDVLNRLLVLLVRSFPAYLTYAKPHVGPGDEHSLEVVQQIVADQEALAARINEAICENGACPYLGEFPLEFTDLHDLDLDYLVKVAIGYQKQDVAAIADCVEDLRLAPAFLPLAQEALGMAKGHLESLLELAHQPA